MRSYFSVVMTSVFLLSSAVAAQDAPFSVCPLLGPRFPILPSSASSPTIDQGLQNLTAALDNYVLAGSGDFGAVTPNTTSFSVSLFFTEDTNSTKPFFYEYHHTSNTLKNATEGAKKIDADSVYRVGDLTTLFTTWLFLIEAGEEYWVDPVSKWVPELAAKNSADSISTVQWNQVTLGDLAANLGGIGRYSPSTNLETPALASLLSLLGTTTSSLPCASRLPACARTEFFQYMNTHAPVFAPGTTPIFSNAGFIILAYALETIRGRPFVELLKDTIITPLNLSSTSVLEPPTSKYGVIPSNASIAGWSDPLAIETAFNGIYSSLTDISTALRAVLSSQMLPKAVTQRWLKPVSLTSNSVNSVGRPWEIYSLTTGGPSPVIPIYQVRGNIDLYSSHIGLVPDYNVGFVILAADSETNPDLNAFADVISIAMIPALEQNAIVQASTAFAGTYTSTSSKSNSTNETTTLIINSAIDSTPGLSLTTLTTGTTDIRALYAKLNGIEPKDLSFRLYPTDLVSKNKNEGTKKLAMRAVFQDLTAVGDAGTPTCDTWRGVDAVQIGGVGIDEFVFEMRGGLVTGLEVPALGLRLGKEG
ncbi:beta-lactamase/transpeptidase-like protein [Pleomassaria siparia CBS 279.74]|uniref:Beta-lactamase/transpeptidase-like protein n=1 Tax=Pleomassaria siparia CBS 279.74 TaxID=1314801 RepID=A0A6G1KL95_9PLEO|nr:beta-lactamase/transpeptidase-like protein [Pleomassaria siparia CBS 279.74]